jgi:ribosomal protein S18 acetylase RimI-like enzyme
VAETRPISLTVEASSPVDLQLLRLWTTWTPESGRPCVVARDRYDECFRDGRLRVVSAWSGDEKVGISLVAAPMAGPEVDGWRAPAARFVPATECLLWVGLAIAPSFRRTGLALELVRSTMEAAVMTGYPYVLALFPVHDRRCAALLNRTGFTRADAAAGRSAREYAAYLRLTPSLAAAR